MKIEELNTTQQRMALVFAEWQRRRLEDPDSFSDIEDPEEYGIQSVLTFEKIAEELDSEGVLPQPTT